MRIESISLKNFKGFRNAVMTDIPPFCVVIGANGSEKRRKPSFAGTRWIQSGSQPWSR